MKKSMYVFMLSFMIVTSLIIASCSDDNNMSSIQQSNKNTLAKDKTEDIVIVGTTACCGGFTGNGPFSFNFSSRDMENNIINPKNDIEIFNDKNEKVGSGYRVQSENSINEITINIIPNNPNLAFSYNFTLNKQIPGELGIHESFDSPDILPGPKNLVFRTENYTGYDPVIAYKTELYKMTFVIYAAPYSYTYEGYLHIVVPSDRW